MSTLEPQLAALCAWTPIGNGWSRPELFVQAVDVSGCTVHVVGLSAVHEGGALVYGSAAELTAPPLERAYFELLERSVTLDAIRVLAAQHDVLDESGRVIGLAQMDDVFPRTQAPAPWRYARSNGIAAHTSWSAACAAARLELIERDCVLRSWFGGLRPRCQPLCAGVIPPPVAELYDVAACSLSPARPEHSRARSELPVVAVVVAFPRTAGLPLAQGFAARFTLDRALADAGRECLQALAFLWGEPLPDAAPAPSTDPGFHQDYYLHPAHHRQLRAWLAGDHGRARVELAASAAGRIGFVDLTPPSLRGRMFIAKAIPDGELPLTFGPGHPSILGSVPEPLRVHPIA